MHRMLLVLALLLLAATPARAQERILVGQTVKGALTDDDLKEGGPKFYDVWRFQARRGVTYVITLLSEDFDAYLCVGPASSDDCGDGCQVNDDGGGGTNARLLLVAENSGEHVIRVTTYTTSESGRYTLWVAEEDSPAAADSAADSAADPASPRPERR